MRAGSMRHRMKLQRPSETRTTDGGYTETWVTLAEPAVGMRPLKGREFLEAQQNGADVSHELWLRHDTTYTITPRDRFLYGTRVFNIESAVNVNEDSRFVSVAAKEVV